MNNSIVARMQREKAERERVAEDRQDSASTRNFATTFGKRARATTAERPR